LALRVIGSKPADSGVMGTTAIITITTITITTITTTTFSRIQPVNEEFKSL